MRLHPHAYFTAGAFVASCAVAGALFGAAYALLSERFHDLFCPCGAEG